MVQRWAARRWHGGGAMNAEMKWYGKETERQSMILEDMSEGGVWRARRCCYLRNRKGMQYMEAADLEAQARPLYRLMIVALLPAC